MRRDREVANERQRPDRPLFRLEACVRKAVHRRWIRIDERPGAARYRGFHTNRHDICIGCGTCETVCQNAAIDLGAG
ncbi:4Fe-4S binding protein [Halomonas sp.]|uniref:4Fe-4S binding protein n=1 Tax=Halomonas sp. TaxID=1486246 RepID=UPI003A0FD18A